MKEGTYGKHSNSIVSISLDILYLSADQPERQALTPTRKEGTHENIIGWVANVSEE